MENSALPSLSHEGASFPWVLILAGLAAAAAVSMLVLRLPAVAFLRGAAEARPRVRPESDRPRQPSEIADPEEVVRHGETLEARGDLDGAIAAYRHAAEHGHPDGAVSLGVLLAEQGDLSGAMDAFTHADRLGHPAGAFNLGVVLEGQGDLDGALSAFTRAQTSGDAHLADQARAAVSELSRRSAD